jgi:hypothetical protein
MYKHIHITHRYMSTKPKAYTWTCAYTYVRKP